jgi:hypothetical protein
MDFCVSDIGILSFGTRVLSFTVTIKVSTFSDEGAISYFFHFYQAHNMKHFNSLDNTT